LDIHEESAAVINRQDFFIFNSNSLMMFQSKLLLFSLISFCRVLEFNNKFDLYRPNIEKKMQCISHNVDGFKLVILISHFQALVVPLLVEEPSQSWVHSFLEEMAAAFEEIQCPGTEVAYS